MSQGKSIDTVASQGLIERVALLSLHSSPLAKPGGKDAGGMNVYVSQLAGGLASRGVHVDVFTRRTNASVPTSLVAENGVRIIHVDAGPARHVPKHLLPLHIPAMVRSIRDFTERERLIYDVWHSHYWLSGLVAMRTRNDPRAPVIHMFHTLSRVKKHFSRVEDDKDSALREDGERCLIPSVDAVVGATAGERSLLVDLYKKEPRQFEVIPCGVDLTQFQPYDRRQSRERLDLVHGDEQIVLFVGRIEPIKGIDLLVRSVARLQCREGRPVKLVVVGGHDTRNPQLMRSLRRQTESLGVGNLVEFRGMVPHDELPLYYSAADVCAMPSSYESFGMVAVEAMACGTPVVGFGVGGLATTVDHGLNGFLARPSDELDFTRQLENALTSNKPESLRRHARFSARQYDWNSVIDQTLSLYERTYADRMFSDGRAAGEC